MSGRAGEERRREERREALGGAHERRTQRVWELLLRAGQGRWTTCSNELVLSFSKPKMSRMPMTCAHCGPRLTSLIFLTIRSKRRE
tara:strand:- start:1480 stop:1737 length:258 start_codon:yes stop_codon:yes gene_type:complete